MKTREVAIRFGEPVIAMVPEDRDIESLAVGGLAPDCFGRMSEVTEIFHVGKDIHGALFACYYTRFSPGATISHSMKSGELVRTVPLTALYKSVDCDRLEWEMTH